MLSRDVKDINHKKLLFMCDIVGVDRELILKILDIIVENGYVLIVVENDTAVSVVILSSDLNGFLYHTGGDIKKVLKNVSNYIITVLCNDIKNIFFNDYLFDVVDESVISKLQYLKGQLVDIVLSYEKTMDEYIEDTVKNIAMLPITQSEFETAKKGK